MAQKTKLERFENEVISRFNLYNSVFSTLPYSHISKTATLLPFFAEFCALGFDQNKNPIEIVEEFSNNTILTILKKTISIPCFD